MSDLAHELQAILTQKDPASGAALFPPQQAEDALALLLIAFRPPALDASAAMVLGRFAQRAGVVDGMDDATTSSQIAAYVRANPVPDALGSALRLAIRRAVERDGAAATKAAFGRFVGEAPAAWQPPQPPPDGAVRGGPLLRASLKKR